MANKIYDFGLWFLGFKVELIKQRYSFFEISKFCLQQTILLFQKAVTTKRRSQVVIERRNKFKIFQFIIKFIPVYMMNFFYRQETATKMLSHY